MSTETEKKLRTEQSVPLFDYNTVVLELIKNAKAQKEDLDHQIVLATSNLQLLREQHIRQQGEFNQWKMAEEQKFRNDLSKKHNQLIDQENKMNLLNRDLEQRSADLRVKEERVMQVENDRVKINNDRIDVEKMRVAAHNSISEADRKISEANNIMNQANMRMEQVSKTEDKNAQRNQELAAREGELQVRSTQVALEVKHLSEIKDFVEPKIKELTELEASIELSKKATEDREREANHKLEEDKFLLKALEDKKLKLDRFEVELKSREEELKRRVLMFESKK